LLLLKKIIEGDPRSIITSCEATTMTCTIP
jgi:hypothetical protein